MKATLLSKNILDKGIMVRRDDGSDFEAVVSRGDPKYRDTINAIEKGKDQNQETRINPIIIVKK